MTAPGYPAHARYFRIRVGPVSLRTERRSVVVAGCLVVALLALGTVGLLVGDYRIAPVDILRALAGTATDPLGSYFVADIRLPRVVAALTVGAALGMSGGIFQRLSGNPLGSPDVIGFTTGSATGALVVIVLLGGTPLAVAGGAFAGGAVTAALVYTLAYRGGLTSYRLVLVGLGVAAVLAALNSLLVVRADLDSAQDAAHWLAGSLNALPWGGVLFAAAAVAALAPCAAALSRPLGMLALGDDIATGLGVRVQWVRLALLLVGVALVATATALAGPIAFIALAAPQIAARLSRSSGVGLGLAALTGALLVLGSDLIAQRLYAPTQLPVGVVSGALGGLYLIGLLVREWRKIG
ncbi:iron-enterobactin ABC transporter permease [Klugiella xanthotipulae]|uniref:Iron complex transport system permease protein n=1 Tax=Klugiella xanthotipulae TaxID=244735 RepID=A0A543HHB6_9MICO|nr:iron chelate uptake ABC transporter family permease subunit [Klugiella xanthotipulae]TQM57722.1 iron complex transport system permease protein [Klugiella xanthotipulae]